MKTIALISWLLFVLIVAACGLLSRSRDGELILALVPVLHVLGQAAFYAALTFTVLVVLIG